jgi:benzoyl-CoA reductase subunit C
VTDEALAEAIALCNENRRLLSEVAALRGGEGPRLTGAQALQIIGSAATTSKIEHNELLRALLKAAESLPAHTGLPVVYSGTETETLIPYEAIEAGGAVIVADDQEWGSRAVETLTDETIDPMDAIVDRYQFRSPASAGHVVKERAPYLIDVVARSGAQAVAFYIQAIDHPASWDYPRLRDRLNASGVATLELGPRHYLEEDAQGLTDQISRFVAAAVRAPAA